MKNIAPTAGPLCSGGLSRFGLSAAITFLALGFVASPANAIDNFPFIVEAHLQAEQLAFSQRINGSVDVPRGPDFNRQIADARKAYWKAYASGRIAEDVENRFATLLAEKDVSMMLMILSDQATSDALGQFGVGDLRTEELLQRLWGRMSESVDGGIRPGAWDAFMEWEAVVKHRMDADPDLNPLTISLVAMKALGASLEARDPQVRAYVEARNRAEMKAVLDELPFDSDRDYLLTRLNLDANDAEHVTQWYEQLEQLAGRQVMDEIAGATRKLRKDGNGNIDGPDFVDANGKELRLSAKDRIERLVGNSSPRLYTLWQIRLTRDVSWPEARQMYQTYWVEPFGEQKVLEAAEKVRTAEKAVSPLRREVLLDPIAGTSSPERALAKLMPYLPYRDLSSGSPDSTDSQQSSQGEVAYFDSLAEAAWHRTPEMIREYEHKFAAEEYENLVNAFGQEKVAAVVARVRAAVEEKADLATLEGTVSGSQQPLAAVYEILWSSSPEEYLEYLRPDGSSEFYYRQYGREALLAAIKKVAGAKKQLGSLESFDTLYFGTGNRVLLVDRQSIGLPPLKGRSDLDELTVMACLSDLLHQPTEAVAAVPFEVGRHFYNVRDGSNATILRVFEGDDGVQYLVDTPNRAYWVADELIRTWKPVAEPGASTPRRDKAKSAVENRWPDGSKVRVVVDRGWRDGEVVFFESRSKPATWAVRYEPADPSDGSKGIGLFTATVIRARPQTAASPSRSARLEGSFKPEDFPDGSRVRLKWRNEILEGTIREYHTRHGWKVDIQTPSQLNWTWVRPNQVELYELTLIDPPKTGASNAATK